MCEANNLPVDNASVNGWGAAGFNSQSGLRIGKTIAVLVKRWSILILLHQINELPPFVGGDSWICIICIAGVFIFYGRYLMRYVANFVGMQCR